MLPSACMEREGDCEFVQLKKKLANCSRDAHPASVSTFQSDDNQTLCCDIPPEWKDYIRHRWLPIVDLTTTEPWEALDFARAGKPFAATAIKLVSDQNYQRIINQCARTVVEDSELCMKEIGQLFGTRF
eukprot:symbB.v1.2.001788.t1/scaffold95.1/size600632/36